MKDALYKKFTKVPTRPGRGGTYSYIRWQDVADRMNQIFGTKWSSEVVYQDVVGSNVVTRVRVTILDDETNVVFFQEGFGGAPMDDRQEAGNPFKSAYSKALKDACKKWGVGLYIDEEEQNLAETAKVPYDSYHAVNTPVELNMSSDTVNLNTTNTNTQTPFVPPTTNKVVKNTVTVKQHEVPSIPTIPSIPQTTINSKPAMNSTNNVIPVMPPMPDVKTPTSGGMGDTNSDISDVQKAALQSILSIQGAEYEELITDAFNSKDVSIPEKIPTMDSLSYKEAVIVIKYGNDKFRKH